MGSGALASAGLLGGLWSGADVTRGSQLSGVPRRFRAPSLSLPHSTEVTPWTCEPMQGPGLGSFASAPEHIQGIGTWVGPVLIRLLFLCSNYPTRTAWRRKFILTRGFRGSVRDWLSPELGA